MKSLDSRHPINRQHLPRARQSVKHPRTFELVVPLLVNNRFKGHHSSKLEIQISLQLFGNIHQS